MLHQYNHLRHPFQPNNLKPIATMDGEKFEYTTTTEVENECAKAIIDKFLKETVYYGLDAEWCRGYAANSTQLF